MPTSAMLAPKAVTHKAVLVLEDDEIDYQCHRKLLSEDPFEVYELTRATTVAQGLKLATEGQFDCILIDYNLPDGTGLEFITKLKAMTESRLPALVFLTGQGDSNLAVKAMKEGAQDYLEKNKITAEMLARAVRNAVHAAELQMQLEESNSKLREKALHDPLTGLANRTLFEDRCENAISLAQRNNTPLAILSIDLNDFKLINDTYGHDMGDTVLKEISRRMEGQLRNTDTLARLGGDEFAVLLQGIIGMDAAFMIVRRLAGTAYPLESNHGAIPIGLSIGMAYLPDDGTTYTDLIKKADQNMYEEKQNKKKMLKN